MSNDDGRIDRLIDDVAREMTGAPVRGDLAQRVSARLREPADGGTAVWWRPWLAVTAAASALAIAAILVREARPPAPASTPRTADAPAAVAPRSAAAATQASSGLTSAPVPGTRPVSTPRLAVPAYPDLPPLTIAELDVPPLAAERPIEVAAIPIEGIEIAAMP